MYYTPSPTCKHDMTKAVKAVIKEELKTYIMSSGNLPLFTDMLLTHCAKFGDTLTNVEMGKELAMEDLMYEVLADLSCVRKVSIACVLRWQHYIKDSVNLTDKLTYLAELVEDMADLETFEVFEGEDDLYIRNLITLDCMDDVVMARYSKPILDASDPRLYRSKVSSKGDETCVNHLFLRNHGKQALRINQYIVEQGIHMQGDQLLELIKVTKKQIEEVGADTFAIPLKYDTRGRTYYDSFIINPQGCDWQRALIQLDN